MAIITNQAKILENIYNQSFEEYLDKESFMTTIGKIFEETEAELEKSDHDSQLETLKKSLANRIVKVQSRIGLISELRKKAANADNIAQVYALPGLITYLILTCFDQLGQSKLGWYFFPDWLSSKKTSAEVNEILKNLNTEEEYVNSDEAGRAKILFMKYHKIYGVKNAFFNFVRNVLPSQVSRNLFDSILDLFWYENQAVTTL